MYGLPPDPVVTTRDLPAMWRHAGMAAAGLLAGVGALLRRAAAVNETDVTQAGQVGGGPAARR